MLLLWSIPGVVATSQVVFFWKLNPQPTVLEALFWQLPQWWFWAAATPLVLFLGRRFPIERGRWILSLPLHLVACAILSAGHMILVIRLGYAVGYKPSTYPFLEVLWRTMVKNAELDLVTYFGVIAIAYALEYHRRSRDAALAASRLQAQLAQAQLDALKAQLHPHFLFNTLHAIGVLVRKQDPQGSIRMITALSELLRLALDGSGRQEVPLRQELDFVERYLGIERIRFQDRLRVVTDVAPETFDAAVPNLILQPIVENAIRHGIAPRAAEGTLTIQTRRAGDRLVITVRDDGAGLREGWQPGVGLGNVRARLAHQYPGRHRFEVKAHPEGGTLVTLEVPFTPAAAEEPRAGRAEEPHD